MSKRIDITGQRYGRLVPLYRVEDNKYGRSVWMCQCDCGTLKAVAANDIRSGKSRSCGCLERENRLNIKDRSIKTHRMTKTRIYRIWQGAKNRVFNKKDEHWPGYGGRGITMCEEWASSFECFRDWAFSNGYSENLTLDRIDFDGDYCPENCRWVTSAEQQRNKRNNRYYTYNGKTQLIPTWAKEFGVTDSTIRSRIRRGEKPEKVFFELSKQVV